jgi:hypothetical protein
MVTTSCDEGDNDKDTSDSNKELIAAVERNFKRQSWQPIDHFEKLLLATYPNHMYLVRNKLKECTKMKNYMTTGTFARGKKPERDSMGKVATPFSKTRQSCRFMAAYPPPLPTSHGASSSLPVEQSMS